ncbi:MAG: phosphomethylpyrimidine synthase ThiC [bacterium]|nr:phosphomethylpyrimidine synthase ThiC [bacterium]
MSESEAREVGTQIESARAGKVTRAMEEVGREEGMEGEEVRREVACGRMVIPANKRHTNLKPIGIGVGVRCKVNANIGCSPGRSDVEEEGRKLEVCLRYGADTVMDLSTGARAGEVRKELLARCPVPFGTVPVYDVAGRAGGICEARGEDFVAAVREHAEAGVDFMTIHAGLLRRMIPLALKRRLGIVSRGGAQLARWMEARGAENPYYERFDEVLEICHEYDVTISLGDGLRPGCLADASDAAQFAELEVLGELTERCWAAGVQVMVEGPGHIPLHEVAMNVERQMRVCKGAPFYVLGPVVCDIAPGYDHISSAIGAAVAGMAGAAMLCYVTPKEHLGLPDVEDVRVGLIAYKIAAHAADVARGRRGARDWDDAMAEARRGFDWEKQFKLALDPERAREYYEASNVGEGGRDYCTMCGREFCAVRASQEVRGGRG